MNVKNEFLRRTPFIPPNPTISNSNNISYPSNGIPSNSNPTLPAPPPLPPVRFKIPLNSFGGTETLVNVDSRFLYRRNQVKKMIAESAGINHNYITLIIHEKGGRFDQNPKILTFSEESIITYEVTPPLLFDTTEIPEDYLEYSKEQAKLGAFTIRCRRFKQRTLLLQGLEVYLKRDSGVEDELVEFKLNSDKHLELVHLGGTEDERVEKLDKVIGGIIYSCPDKADILTLRFNNPDKKIDLRFDTHRSIIILSEALFSDNGLLFGNF
jgi:hypothetical protein